MKKVVVLIFVLLCVVSVVVYVVLVNMPKRVTNDAGDSLESTQSVSAFDKFVGFETGENYWSKSNDFFDPAFSSNWNYKKDMISAQILKVDKPGRKMTIKIGLPDGKVFTDKALTMQVECLSEKTNQVGVNLTLVESNFDIFEKAEAQNKLFAYCLDEMCSSLGNECVLIK